MRTIFTKLICCATIAFHCLWAGAQDNDFWIIEKDQCRVDTLLETISKQWQIEAGMTERVTLEYPEYEKADNKETALLSKLHDGLPQQPKIETFISQKEGKRILTASLIPWVKRGKNFYRLTSCKLTLQHQSHTRMDAENASPVPQTRYAPHSALASGRWVKVSTDGSGIYKITYEQLKTMGFKDPQKVRIHGYGGAELPTASIEDLPDDLPEIACWREDSYLLFEAQGPISWHKSNGRYIHKNNTYANAGHYFITESDSISPMEFPTMSPVADSQTGKQTWTSPAYHLYEKDEFNWLSRGRLFTEKTDYATKASQEYTLRPQQPDTTQTAILDVSFTANNHNKNASTLAIVANETLSVGNMTIASSDGYSKFSHTTKQFTIPASQVKEQTKFNLTHTSGREARLDYLRLNYTRRLDISKESHFYFYGDTDEEVNTFHITGANQNTRIWKIVDGKIEEVPGTLENGTYSATATVTPESKFLALNTQSSSFPTVKVIGEVGNQNLHAQTPAELVIVIPSGCTWAEQAERLAALHRQYDNMTAVVVETDQIYNEFSSGTPDATAIRRFMKMLYDKAERQEDRPKHLLLFADASFDNRMITDKMKGLTTATFLPCFQSENSTSEVSSYVMEEYFCLLDDGEGNGTFSYAMSDASVGRLPVRNLQQATTVVDKIEAYITNKEPGAWKNKILMLADDNDKTSYHLSDADDVAQNIQAYAPNMMIEKIYWDTYEPENSSTGIRYPQITKRIYEAIREGALIINYSGHGRADALSHEYTWQLTDMAKASTNKLPLWFTAACDVTPFDLEEENLGEEALFNTSGGAIAMVGTTRSVYPDRNKTINNLFHKHLFTTDQQGISCTIGEALRKAKNDVVSGTSVNHLHYVLLGDPALKPAIPDNYHIIIHEFNGNTTDANDTQLQAKAGDKIIVKGVVTNATGEIATDFNGMLHSTLFDSEETIEGVSENGELKNDVYYSFTTRSRKLFSGKDSVKQGEFTLTFPIPLDISYSNASGKIHLYAVNESRQEAQGYFEDFVVGGTTEQLSNDTLGPEINVFFNTPDFIAGSSVNETPMLYIDLYDPDGINATGNGLGHDLIAIIDNDPSMTYILNSYYYTIAGDYTRGSIAYSLPTLPEGEHTLMIRAWDILNNSTTTTIPFKVVTGLKPQLTDVWCTPSPAKTSTTFIIKHNRPQTQLDIELQVFDFSGRLLWEHHESEIPESNESHITWNLTTTNGQPIQTGVYLFRANISSAGGGKAAKARKIVINKQ